MRNENGYSKLKIITLLLTSSMMVLWLGLHANLFFTSQNGFIRTTLSILFALLILLRTKPEGREQRSKVRGQKPDDRRLRTNDQAPSSQLPAPRIIFPAFIGICFTSIGIIFTIHQLQWLGLLVLAYAGLRWSMPIKFSRDIPLALFVLYWANPLPNQIFTQLQIWMQIASVNGSEWLLHIFNVRVWADGLILRTDAYLFEVPAWCSGMRTATTVFILSIALGVLRRMRWHETIILTVWSLFHALLLNIIRICIMVIFSQHTHNSAGLEFLHNTAGIVVIGGVLVVYLELLYIEHRRQWQIHIKSEINQAHFENISEFPPFWKRVLKYRKVLLIITLAILLSATLMYRSRPYHRAMMIKEVATALRDQGDLKTAQRAAQAVSKLIPDNLEWKFAVARLQIICGKHDKALAKLKSIQNVPKQYQTMRKVLMAYALMCLGRIDEAAAIVDKLPQDIRKSDPRIAMIMAEMALRGNDPDAVAMHVVVASGWAPNVGRIRNLYPYLHIHRFWKAMADSAIDIPYRDPVQAFSILEAYMNLDRVPEVANITMQAIQQWPNDMRILEPLYFMVIKRANSKWETLFATSLLRAIKHCDNPDILFETMYKTFSISRPDLAWAIYWRIHEIDPNHPTLYMSVAKYGNKWFTFRKRFLGIPAAQATDTLDLKPFYILGKYLPKWIPVIKEIPHGSELSAENSTPIRKKFLKKAIVAFENKLKQPGPPLSLDMQYLYAMALEMSSRVDLAKAQLESIAKTHPKDKERVRIMLSEIYERKGDWISVYETLRTYLDPRVKDDISLKELSKIKITWPPQNIPMVADDKINLKPLLRLIKSQRHLNLRIAALHTAKEAVRIFPYSSQAAEQLALAQLDLGNSEEALQLLGKPRPRKMRKLDILEAKALFKTERYNELTEFCHRNMLPPWNIPTSTTQHTSLPPAELSLLWHRVSIPSESQFAENAKLIRHNLASASAGLRKMLELWLKAYNQHCAGNLADPAIWAECGRDPVERAIALNQLTLLLCREERYTEAKVAARSAVASLPKEPLLWQILISLSDDVHQTISYARKSCPDSPEIWLADLVNKTQKINQHPAPSSQLPAPNDQSTHDLVSEAIEKQFPPAIITRAAEYLWRINTRSEATRLARSITDRARGLLPAYIISMRCALYSNDREWALKSTEHAINSALKPLPEFYENLVNIKTANGVVDIEPDMVNALRNLRLSDPGNPKWAQMLGYIRFKRGGWEIIDAMTQMQAAINNGATNTLPYIIAAEASRLLQNYDRAADILNKGLKHHPEDKTLINNLAYDLTYSEKNKDKAIAMIPVLKSMASDSPQIKDTLAVVYLRTGDLNSAHATITEILKDAQPGSATWFRAKTHLAEIAWKQGEKRDAVAILKTLLKNLKHIPDEDILQANTLLSQIVDEKSKATLEILKKMQN